MSDCETCERLKEMYRREVENAMRIRNQLEQLHAKYIDTIELYVSTAQELAELQADTYARNEKVI